jgi:hypothetical protein
MSNNKWISVNFTLPDRGVNIVLYSNGCVQRDTFKLYHCDDVGFYWTSNNLDIQGERFPMKNKDRWMPLPKPPEQLK